MLCFPTMDSHLNLDKCNTITTESLENETVKCHPQYRRDFTNGTKLNRKLKQQTREKEESSAEITVEEHQEEPLDIRMRRKSKEIMSSLFVTRKPNEKRDLDTGKR